MRQVEVSRTLVFDAPRQARAFFEALIADNLDLGRPENVEVLFKRSPRGRKPKDQAGGVFKTAIDRRCERRDHQRLLAPFPREAVPEGRPGPADRDRGELAR